MSESFPSSHVQFADADYNLTYTERSGKHGIVLGAATLSQLAYENGHEVSAKFGSDARYDAVRYDSILSGVWSSGYVERMFGLTPSKAVIAWSNRYQTVFIALRGTSHFDDIRSDVNIAQKSSIEGAANRYHGGFYNAAGNYTKLIVSIARRFNTVICGHSKG
jgi:hypothetical protein